MDPRTGGRLHRRPGKFLEGLVDDLIAFAEATFAGRSAEPPDLIHIWRWFVDLDGQRQSGWAMQAITWADIAAYLALQSTTPAAWETETIVAIDHVYLRHIEREREKREGRASPKDDMIRAAVDDKEAVSRLFAALN